MAGLHLISSPDDTAISLEDLRSHSRVDARDDDTMLSGYIAAATLTVEGFIKQKLLAHVYEQTFDFGFPNVIRTDIGPVMKSDDIVITYTDDAGVVQTLDHSSYQVSLGPRAVIIPAYGQTWPTTRHVLDAVRVRFTAGAEKREDIHKAITQALLMTAATLYEFRENIVVGASVAEVPENSRNILIPFVRDE